jgi:hypothetical protein
VKNQIESKKRGIFFFQMNWVCWDLVRDWPRSNGLTADAGPRWVVARAEKIFGRVKWMERENRPGEEKERMRSGLAKGIGPRRFWSLERVFYFPDLIQILNQFKIERILLEL